MDVHVLCCTGTGVYYTKYRLVLEACNTAAPPDFRSNPQLFKMSPDPTTGRLRLISGMYLPDCDTCGNVRLLTVEACRKWDTAACKEYLTNQPANSRSVLAVAGYAW